MPIHITIILIEKATFSKKQQQLQMENSGLVKTFHEHVPCAVAFSYFPIEFQQVLVDLFLR